MWDEAELVVVAARVTVAVTLLAASYAKLTDFTAWQGAVNRLGRVRERLATPLAYVIPALELGLGIGLLAGAFVRWLAAATTVLLMMFTWVLLSALAHGVREDCACFGRLVGSKVGVATLIRNGVLMFASLIVALAPTDAFARDVSSTIRAGASDEPWLLGLVVLGLTLALATILQAGATRRLIRGIDSAADTGS